MPERRGPENQCVWVPWRKLKEKTRESRRREEAPALTLPLTLAYVLMEVFSLIGLRQKSESKGNPLGQWGEQPHRVLDGLDEMGPEPQRLRSAVWLPLHGLAAGGERVSHPLSQASVPFPVGSLKPPHALLVLERTVFRATMCQTLEPTQSERTG